MPKSRLVTVLLLIMTVGLMAAIFYLGFILTQPPEKPSPVAPARTKAAATTYNKTIALNQTTLTVTPTPTPVATNTPTPTEIILALVSPTTSAPPLAATSSATPTKTTSLPATGYVNNALIIFATAGLIVFFSFLF